MNSIRLPLIFSMNQIGVRSYETRFSQLAQHQHIMTFIKMVWAGPLSVIVSQVPGNFDVISRKKS
jgi:hypothetical protein